MSAPVSSVSSGATLARRTVWLWLLVLLVALAGAWLGWQLRPAVRLDLGTSTDTGHVAGFYERETDGPTTYRWSSPEGVIRLPQLGTPLLLQLDLVGPPGGNQVSLLVGQQPPVPLWLDAIPLRRYHLLLAPSDPGAATLPIQFQGQGFQTPTDPRQLVARVSQIELDTLGGWHQPPRWPWAQVGGLALLILALLQVIGLPPLAAAVSGSLLAGGLGLTWALQPLWVGPYLTPLLLGLGAIVATLALLRWLVVRSTAPPEARLLAVVLALAALLPLYRYLAAGWDSWFHWRNLPILLLPVGAWLLAARTPRGRNWALAVLLSLCAGYAAGMLGLAFRGDYGRDFHAIYRGVGRLVQANGPLYDLATLAANPLSDSFKYPPTFVPFFAFFTQFEFVTAFTLWRLLNLGLLILALFLLLRAAKVPLRSWSGAALLALVCTQEAIFDALRHGQIDLIILVLAAAALLAAERGRHGLGGVWLGLAAVIKLYPAYLLLLPLVRGRWAALLGAALTGLGLAAITLLWLGWEPFVTFVATVLPLTGVGTGWVENQSFGGWLNRLRTPGLVSLVPDDGSLRGLTYAWAAGVTLLTAWLIRPQAGLRYPTAFGLTCTAMLLAMPAVWTHYQTVLLIAAWSVFLVAREQPERLTWPVIACLGLSWMLLAFGNAWTFFDRRLFGPFWLLLLSYKFYGALLLFVALGLLARPQPIRWPWLARLGREPQPTPELELR